MHTDSLTNIISSVTSNSRNIQVSLGRIRVTCKRISCITHLPQNPLLFGSFPSNSAIFLLKAEKEQKALGFLLGKDIQPSITSQCNAHPPIVENPVEIESLFVMCFQKVEISCGCGADQSVIFGQKVCAGGQVPKVAGKMMAYIFK